MFKKWLDAAHHKWFDAVHRRRSGLALIAIILIVVGVLAIAGGIWYWRVKTESINPVACTQEAKICPDGSSVGRVGPDCEFAACPSSATASSSQVSTSTQITKTESPSSTSSTGISNWQIYQNEEYGFEIQYPSFLKIIENPKTPEVYLYSISFENPLADQSTAGQKIVFNITVFKDNNQFQDAFKSLSLEDKGKVTVGGYQAEKLFSPKGAAVPFSEVTVYTIAQKNTVLILYGSDFSEISQNDINVIVSTFKFIK